MSLYDPTINAKPGINREAAPIYHLFLKERYVPYEDTAIGSNPNNTHNNIKPIKNRPEYILPIMITPFLPY